MNSLIHYIGALMIYYNIPRNTTRYTTKVRIKYDEYIKQFYKPNVTHGPQYLLQK